MPHAGGIPCSHAVETGGLLAIIGLCVTVVSSGYVMVYRSWRQGDARKRRLYMYLLALTAAVQYSSLFRLWALTSPRWGRALRYAPRLSTIVVAAALAHIAVVAVFDPPVSSPLLEQNTAVHPILLNGVPCVVAAAIAYMMHVWYGI